MAYGGAMTNSNATATHDLAIRTISEDGELIDFDQDFAEDAALDWFSEKLKAAEAGESVQLINLATDAVLNEVFKQD